MSQPRRGIESVSRSLIFHILCILPSIHIVRFMHCENRLGNAIIRTWLRVNVKLSQGM
jgi:hypothetical protein